jgi:hypothetical protein
MTGGLPGSGEIIAARCEARCGDGLRPGSIPRAGALPGRPHAIVGAGTARWLAVPNLRIAQDPSADDLLGRAPLALLIGMLLDQRMRQRSSDV